MKAKVLPVERSSTSLDQQRAKAMQTLKLSDDFHKRVLDSMLEGCQIIAFDWTYLYLNAMALTQSRRSSDELVGRRFTEVWPGIEQTPLYSHISDCLTHGVASEFENEFYYPDGKRGWFELRISPVDEGAFIMSIDITRRKELEALLRKSDEQLQQSQKLESIGRLAAGVAHDFNNMLSVILGRVELATIGRDVDDQIRSHLLEIQKAAESSARLTKQLLAFARRQTIAPRTVDINELIEDRLAMIRTLVGSTIEVIWIPHPDLDATFVDISQFEQVLLNLCINARDAIDSEGTITIETSNSVVDEQYMLTHVDAIVGNFVQLSVSDSGCGIARENLAKIFEPFFTSKQLGRGTGLGLSIVYGIVRQNNGFVNVYSEVGNGTTFRVYLPCISDNAIATATPAADEYLSRGNETVLLVDDEPAILDVTTQLLESLGYHVLATSSPAEAIRIANDYPQEIHLLCTDVVMQGITGPALATSIRRSRPTMKLLYTSGYTENVVVHNGVVDPGINFLNKPFTMRELNTKTRAALDAKVC